MDTYIPLLQKTKVPQPSLQRFAVISIFSKLRNASSRLGPDSESGREAIRQCLRSASPSVVEQSVMELCRLVADSNLDLSRVLLELQASLEGCHSRFVAVFVKGIGFLVRHGFGKDPLWRFSSPENHPFVKILSCQADVQTELVRQLLLLCVQAKQLGFGKVCNFLRPFMNFSILRIPFSDSSSASFVRHLVSALTLLFSSFPFEALPILKLLIGCLKYFPLKESEDFNNFFYCIESMVDAHIVVLRHLVGKHLELISETQLCGMKLLGVILSLHANLQKHSGGTESIIKLSKHLLVVQKELGLQYIPEISSIMTSLFLMLLQSELEYEQLSMLKLLLFLFKWKSESEHMVETAACNQGDKLLLILPVINLLSSPSKPVKEASTKLLFMLEKLLVELMNAPKKKMIRGDVLLASTLDSIIIRLLQHLWDQVPCSFFLDFVSAGNTDFNELNFGPKSWASKLKEHSQNIVEKQKASLPISWCQQVFSTEIPPLVGAILSVFILHQSWGSTAMDSLVAIGTMDPRMGVQLLLAILFYINLFSTKGDNNQDKLLALLGMLPSLTSHSVMVPVVVQTILPMLHKDAKPVLYATATRVLCKTWEASDRAFGSLQGVLLATSFVADKSVSVSIAASVRDVCRRNPDRGVDILLSISACIESRDHIIHTLGLQSLAHLCDADVIDFYTAWDVVAKHLLVYSADPTVAHGLCIFLRWGAMDAEAHAEDSKRVVLILWGIGTSRNHNNVHLWSKARVSAFEALAHYEVSLIEEAVPDFRAKISEFHISEINPEVLLAMEVVEVKIMAHEHINRRRLVKEKKVMKNKIEKLLDVFPQIFSSGKRSARELPAAALFGISFTPKDANHTGVSKRLQDVHTVYENALAEIAASLHLSRNTFVALLSLQSWKSFIKRWMSACMMSLDAKASYVAVDKISEAANDILKSMQRVAEESTPSSAENVAFSIGAFCEVLPPSAHVAKANSSKFLLNWLLQHEHEHRQWSAAISLGAIYSCLHVTDHEQKLQIIGDLLEVINGSKSTLVKGACGVGLGLACRDLLSRAEVADASHLDRETHRMQETTLLTKIVRALSFMIYQHTRSSSDSLHSLATFSLPGTCNMDPDTFSDMFSKNFNDWEEDVWGLAGLVLGLGCSVGAIYRAGAHDAVLKIKTLLVSWISREDSDICKERSGMALSVGCCLALPTVVAFCHRMELINGYELEHILNCFKDLISELVSIKKIDDLHQSLLMVSCVGAGSLLACILNDGVHAIDAECIKGLLELFRKCYSNPYPPIVHLGAMFGVANSLGAGAGIPLKCSPHTSFLHTGKVHHHLVSSHLTGPLLSSPICEPEVTSMMQEFFLVAQNSTDHHLQHYATWAFLFLRQNLWAKEPSYVDSIFQDGHIAREPISQSFSEDSVVMKLSLWLMHVDHSETGAMSDVKTVASVLRCLSQAPRLPPLDWGAIIRRCMRYENWVAELAVPDLFFKKGALRRECLQFSIAHANTSNVLLAFIDELSDLPRFGTLELGLQLDLLIHLADLVILFSGSRLQKLFLDMAHYMSSSVSSYQGYDSDQKRLLRCSCWVGLYECLSKDSIDFSPCISNAENFIAVLFSLMPLLEYANFLVLEPNNSREEWSNAIRCLSKARPAWLLNLLQVDHAEEHGQTVDIIRKIQARARLVKIGAIQSSELGSLKALILNSASIGTWNVVVEVVSALQLAEGSLRRLWLLNTVEISCVTSYPSKALQFLGLLAGSFCKYMPLLILDRIAVLNDLPVTLSSLLLDPGWEVIAESVASLVFTSTERIYEWAACAVGEDGDYLGIDRSENDMAVHLMRVMHQTCVSLKDCLPLEKQLRLANMDVA